MDIKHLVDNGFLIYLEQSKYIIEKIPTILNNKKLDSKVFDTLEESIQFIESFLIKKEWKAIVRYNRGLGVEYRNLKLIEATSLEEAKVIAREEAERLLKDSNIIEIKTTENS
jgi:hypothetical protein